MPTGAGGKLDELRRELFHWAPGREGGSSIPERYSDGGERAEGERSYVRDPD